ncbi:glutaredoxin [Candidatus Paracaedibacter symbiosus]|uniref:glutaredoxin family protein n=1 Tax=Candidatus Paracaedibacter symbiosus TaxID=244582 RepID=UPI000A039A4E
MIYSSKSCYYCTAVKKELDGKKIPYTEKLVDNNPALLKELETKTGKKRFRK